MIYAKLFDEWAAKNDPARARKVYFRIYGESPRELYDKINGLFNKARDKWRGIFGLDDKIRLKPEHLLTCVSFLQDVKLFNANLQVIDEAFEYLITDVAKGKKGQYFTPRWVIDMCVKMLNPKISERVIDTACGSSGFTVHSIFHVAGEQFSTDGLRRAIFETKRKLAARSLKGQVCWLLDNEKLLVSYKDGWLNEKSAAELDYPIFFAVSEKGGKDSGGEPNYKKDANGELMLDR